MLMLTLEAVLFLNGHWSQIVSSDCINTQYSCIFAVTLNGTVMSFLCVPVYIDEIGS